MALDLNPDQHHVHDLQEALQGYIHPSLLEPVLCFVRPFEGGGWAYFTTKPLSEQHGYGWEESVRSAGEPYFPRLARDFHNGISSAPLWSITKLAFEAPFIGPDDQPVWEHTTVLDVNHQRTPWLACLLGNADDPEDPNPVAIWAGTMIPEFFELVEKAGGKVYAHMPFAAVAAARGY